MQTSLGAVFWACDITIRSTLYQHDSRPFPELYPELYYMKWCHIVCCITWSWMPKIIHFMCSMYLLVFTPTENKDGVPKLSVQSTSIFQNCKHSCTFLPLNHLLDDFFPEETDIREIVDLYVRCELTEIFDLPGVADNLDHHLLLHHPLHPGKKMTT